MSRALRWIASACGVRTTYHVASFYCIPFSNTVASGTYTMSPWLHRDNYLDLVQAVHRDHPDAKTPPTITSITKLGR